MRIVRKEEVIDSWGILIEGAQGRAEEIFEKTQAFLERTKVPDVRLERKKVAPGIIRGILGTRRDFLILRQQGNPRLRPYQMFINARDYGRNLDISWYLLETPSLGERIISYLLIVPFFNLFVLPFALARGFGSLIRERRGTLDLDLFDEQDLRAYVTNAHHCLLEAVEKLMIDLNQDPSKIERKSRGFLGIS